MNKPLSPIFRASLGFLAFFLIQAWSFPPIYSAENITRPILFGNEKAPKTLDYVFRSFPEAIVWSAFNHVLTFLLEPENSKSFPIVSVKSSKSISNPKWPVIGSISSKFGFRSHPFTRRKSFHCGIDIRSRYGTPIVAPLDGWVTFAGRSGANGRLLQIRANVFTLSFAHLSQFKCRKGQFVRRGQIIGLVGTSGRATGPHLHFAVQKNGKYLNPENFLGQ